MDEKENILIVDDESIRRSLALILGRKGYETEAAGTGYAAIESYSEGGSGKNSASSKRSDERMRSGKTCS